MPGKRINGQQVNCHSIVKAHEKEVEKAWRHFCFAKVKEHFGTKPKKWRDSRQKAFVKKIKEDAKIGNTILYTFYKKGGFGSAAVENCFFGGKELQKELLTLPEEQSFDGYLEYRQIDDI